MKTRIRPDFQPTKTPSEIKAEFPQLEDLENVLAAFIAYMRSRDRMSADWDAEFWLWCEQRHRQIKQQSEEGQDMAGFARGEKAALPVGESDFGTRYLDRYLELVAGGMAPDEARVQADQDAREGES